MPSITMDGQSFSLDGRRIWLVSGTVCPAKIHRGEWEARLRAARHAGLNCVEVPVVWSLHEPRPGQFTFKGQGDLAGFLKIVHRLGLWAVLRLGPTVDEGMDLGGLPTWLLAQPEPRLRSAAPEFLQAASRFIAAVCDQFTSLQVAGGRKARGPVLLVQAEHRWHCGDETQGPLYLGELDRFLRENGVTVPILNTNDLYQSIDGQIDAWSGSTHPLASARQLRAVHPEQPRLLMGMSVAPRAVWGATPAEPDPPRAARRLVEALAGGAQFNLAPFAAGVCAGFDAGRLPTEAEGFVATHCDPGAPLGESGQRGGVYHAVRRVCTFASQFARVLAALDPGDQPAVLAVDAGPDVPTPAPAPSVIDRRGSQGGVVFVIGAPHAEPAARRATILLSDGSTLPVDTGSLGLAWVVMGAHLVGRTTLDYASLCVFALVGNVLVCFGPAGAPGLISINGAAIDVVVPEKDQPLVLPHEGLTLVVCNERTIDATVLADDAVYIGAAELDAQGQPVAHPAFRKVIRIDAASGAQSTSSPTHARPAPAPVLGPWEASRLEAYLQGTSDRFAAIDGPATLDALGAPSGYGWLRLRFKAAPARTPKVGFFESADRLHLFLAGDPVGLWGVGPGASIEPMMLPFKGTASTLTVLADNLGRLSAGERMGEPKGVFGSVWEVAPFKAGPAQLVAAEPLDPFSFRTPIFGVESGALTDAHRVTWRFQHRAQAPLFMWIDPAPIGPALLLVNDQPVCVLAPAGGQGLALHAGRLARGTNTVQIASVGSGQGLLAALKGAVRFFVGEDNLGARAQWSFAKWEPPAASTFRPRTGPDKGSSKAQGGRPVWWRSSFTPIAPVQSLHLDLTGLTKGQVYVGGENLGRYFVAAPDPRRQLPSAHHLAIPGAMLHAGRACEVLIFDEHGAAPDRVRLTRVDADQGA